MIKRLVLLLVVLCSLLATAALPVSAAQSRASLVDIEDEVMCVQCGTPLNVSKSAIADDQRAFIQRRIEQGQTKEQIKQAMVAEFGPSVLAMPPSDEGFNLAVYVVPVLLGALGLLAIALAARRWRASPGPSDGSALTTVGAHGDDVAPPRRDGRPPEPVHEKAADAAGGPSSSPSSAPARGLRTPTTAAPLSPADEARLAAELAAFDS